MQTLIGEKEYPNDSNLDNVLTKLKSLLEKKNFLRNQDIDFDVDYFEETYGDLGFEDFIGLFNNLEISEFNANKRIIKFNFLFDEDRLDLDEDDILHEEVSLEDFYKIFIESRLLIIESNDIIELFNKYIELHKGKVNKLESSIKDLLNRIF